MCVAGDIAFTQQLLADMDRCARPIHSCTAYLFGSEVYELHVCPLTLGCGGHGSQGLLQSVYRSSDRHLRKHGSADIRPGCLRQHSVLTTYDKPCTKYNGCS